MQRTIVNNHHRDIRGRLNGFNTGPSHSFGGSMGSGHGGGGGHGGGSRGAIPCNQGGNIPSVGPSHRPSGNQGGNAASQRPGGNTGSGDTGYKKKESSIPKFWHFGLMEDRK